MPGSARAASAEGAEVVEGDVVAAEEQLHIEQDAGMSAGQHETVSSGPVRFGRIVSEVTLEEQGGDGRQRERSARMPRPRLFDGIDGEQTSGRDDVVVDDGKG
ncbi:hypothetical protein GCM10027408_36880 [Microbacterium tumbae]